MSLSSEMTTAPAPAVHPGRGGLVVWRLEVAKLARQFRVQAVTATCVLSPFLVLLAVKAQGALPSDTLFGQWLHRSGLALPMVVLGFAGQWGLPLLTAVVAGDIFSAEDHHGTWKTVLTRSRSRNQVFTGKALAAISYSLLELALLTASSMGAGALLGAGPVVGLTGQLVGPGRAVAMVAASWCSQIAPLLTFCSMAIVFSVTTRSSTAGIGGPVLVGLLVQLTSYLALPGPLHSALPGTAFEAWHGIWTQPTFYGPVTTGTAVSTAWFAGLLALAWLVFRRRAIAAW